MWRIVRMGLFCTVFGVFLLPVDSPAQTFEPWRNAVFQQFPETPAVLRSRDIRMSFHRRGKGEPFTRLHYRLRFSFAGSPSEQPSIPYVIMYDEHGTLERLKIGRKRVRKPDRHSSPYSNGALVHSNVLQYPFDIRARRPRQERTLRYRIAIDDLRYLPPLYLSDGFATYQSELLLHIPEWVNLGVVPFHMSDTTRFGEVSSLDAKNTRAMKYTASMLPPVHHLDRLPGPSHILPHVLLVPKAYLASGRWQPLFPDLKALYNWYDSLLEGAQSDVALPETLDVAVQDDLLKAKAIFEFVRDNIRYLAFENGMAGYRPEAPATVLENRYGDCKGMAWLTTAMLRTAGVKAYPGWVATRSLIYDYTYPCIAVDNHMICVAVVEGDTLFLDPTQPTAALGEFGYHLSGKEVLVGMDEGGKLILIPPLDPAQQRLNYAYELELTEQGQLRGTGKIKAAGSHKLSLLQAMEDAGTPEEFIADYCHIPNAEIEVPATVTKDIRPQSGDLDIPFEVFFPEPVEVFNGRNYLQPGKLGSALPEPIDERRPWPVALPVAGLVSWNWNIRTDTLPGPEFEPQERRWTSDCLEVSWEAAFSAGTLNLRLTRYLPYPDIPVGCFRQWNDIIAEVNTILNAYLVLN